MIRKRIILSILAFAACISLRAQNVSDLIISEALAQPDSTCIQDGYGRRIGWIELYNTSTGTVNFAGCFLTDDRNDLKKSPISKTDLRTKLGPRQVAVIFASGNRADGTFYSGITLEPGSTVYLVSNDGRTIIDSLAIPESLPAGKSVIKLADDIRQQHFVPVETPSVPSPGILNGGQDKESKAQRMAEQDPHGWTLSVVSVSVVFSALAILWFFFWLLFERPAKRADLSSRAKSRDLPDSKRPTPEVAAAIALALDMEESGDDYAAIATALHLYLSTSAHDAESFVITIKKAPSAWKEKGHNFRNLPR